MNFNVDSIGQMLISFFLSSEQEAAIAFLQSFYTKDPAEYKALIFLASYGLKKAADAAEKSKTTLDDAAIAAIKTILVASATKNGITL